METNNDAQAYVESETVTPTAAAEVSFGFAVTPQATRMGLTVELELAGADPLDGNYTIFVETAVENESADGEWMELTFCSVTVGEVGLYPIAIVQPIFDKVRARIETNAANPEYAQLTFRWMCDSALTTLDPSA